MRRLLCLPVVAALALVPAQAHALKGGLPDPSFGTNGLTSVSTAPAGERESGNAMALDSLGRVLVGGAVQNNEASDPNSGWTLARFNANGTLDAGFGANGVAKVPGLFGPNVAGEIKALSVVPGSDKVIAGGTTIGPSMNTEFTVARYNANGSLDMSFGPADTGFVRADVSSSFDELEDLAVSPQGAITAVGQAGPNAALARWDSDGALDPSFDGPGVPGNGMFADDVTAGSDDYRDLELEPSGAVRAVGVASGAEGNWLIAHYTPTGARDTSFNGTGFVVTNFSGQSDLGGAVVLVGDTLYVFGSVDIDPGPTTERDFGVVAYNATNGAELPGTKLEVPLPGTQNLLGAGLHRLGGSADPSAERFLMAGLGAFGGGTGAQLMRLRRVNGSSTALEPDPEFGSGGVLTPPSLSGGAWWDVAVDGQNRLVAGGDVGNFETADFSAARFIEETAQAPAPDLDAPVITRARVSPRVWAVNRRGPAEVRVTRRRARRGTTFRYTLSEAARVLFRIERKARGRKVGRKCRRATRRNRKRRACTRFVQVGSFAHAGKAGANRKRFSGKIGRRKLRPARYRATLIATDPAGNASRDKRLNFIVVRR
jgi:uncharacterized delta-60 repeat protein